MQERDRNNKLETFAFLASHQGVLETYRNLT